MTFDRGAARPADQTTVRHANLGIVLQHVAAAGTRSRAQIAAATGLTRGTVSSLVSELIDRELLHETGETTSPRGIGRPGTALELSDVVVGVGLEVNVDYIAVSVEDLTGTVRYQRRINRDNRDSAPRLVLDRIGNAVREALAAAADDGLRPVGVTVAVAGLVEEASGTVVLAPNMVCWPGIEGYNYPFQTPYAESWAWLIDGLQEAAETCAAKGVKLFLEHKNSEPAMKILMRNIGMTLHVIHTLRARGITNVQVNMDWQHLLMNGESLGEYAALLAAEGLLGHQHANSGWGTFDDDNMVGATAFMETLELAVELRRARYGEQGERLGFDLYPYTEDAVAAVGRSVEQWRFIWDVSGRIDGAALREAQSRKDAIRAYELVYAALGA